VEKNRKLPSEVSGTGDAFTVNGEEPETGLEAVIGYDAGVQVSAAPAQVS
jgi:hypothetical protein